MWVVLFELNFMASFNKIVDYVKSASTCFVHIKFEIFQPEVSCTSLLYVAFQSFCV